nr:xanthine dehydrogenase family protein molybdopterin-binding subunit [Halomarina salina]
MLGSRYGHATIQSVDASEALADDRVVAVYTQDDVTASGIDGVLRVGAPEDGTAPDNPLLAGDRARYRGQPVAAVVATERYAARDAIGAIDVDYERKDAVVDPVAAVGEDGPTVHESAPDNVAFDWEVGDESAVESAFAEADTVVSTDIEINRVLPTAMEPRAATARYDPSSDELSLELSTQNPHTIRDDVAHTLDHPAEKVRVRPPDVGGGFGGKLQPYAGQLLAAWAAKRQERPVKWVATRTEDSLSMVHSRQQSITAEAAVDDDGTVRGVRAESVAPVGGYLVPGGKIVPTNLGLMASGQYDIPAVHVRVTGAFTHTAPMAAYRGAGRPEATYFIERLLRTVADELDIDPVELRRRNFVPADAFPYETGLGHTYDSGDYEKTLDRALEMVDYDEFRERQRRARDDGRYLGVGVSCYVEACGAAPGWQESGVVEVRPSGTVVVKSGTAEIGTGHRTAYTQIAAAELGVDFEDVTVVEGDTGEVEVGGGTAGSRSMPLGGSAVQQSAVAVREQAVDVASDLLEASPDDLVVEGGDVHLVGVPDRSVSLAEIASVVAEDSSPDDERGLDATTAYDPPNYTFPFGTHVVVVEVDPEVGAIDLLRYCAVDDVGNQINPKIVEGQIHGGVVQGIGQAIYEDVEYDENGQLLTESLQDYAVPKSVDVPEIETESTVTPCPHNPLGVKGVGEAGAIAAPPAVVNAVADALAPLDPDGLDMPLTAQRVWAAVNGP